jgi:hypothetical protein
MYWLFAALAALVFTQGSGGRGSSKKITQGTAMLKAGRAYRIELEVGGPALLQAADHPSKVAQGVDNGLRMNGAYDVLVQPTIPLLVSYSLVPAGDVPIVLNVPASQMIAGIPADYTFRSVEQIANTRAA